MAAKFESTFYSLAGKKYLIQIHDTTYGGGSTTKFDCIGLSIKYDTGGDEDNRFTPIISSEAAIEMHIDSSDLNDFVEDLVSSYENKYFIYISTDDSPITFKWAGYVLTDLITIEDIDLNLGYSFVLKAKDGLNTLKNIDYSNSGVPYTGKATILNHCLNAFSKLDWLLYAYISTTDYFLASVLNWHAGEYTYSGSNTVLTKARIAHRAFYHRDTKGNYIYKNCYEVLEAICKAFGARLIHSGTGYHLVQINSYLNPTSLTEWQYNYLTTGFTSSSKDYSIQHNQSSNSTPIYRLNGGAFEFFSPLQYTRVEYEHIATRNLLAGAIWNYNDETAKIAEDIQSNNLDSILQLDFGVIYKTTFTNVVTQNLRQSHYVIMRMEIKLTVSGVGDFYYNNNFTWQYNKYVISDGIWSTTGSGYYYFALPQVKNEGEYLQNIQTIIGNIPGDGDLSVKVEFYNIYVEGLLNPVSSILQGESPPVLEDYYTLTYEASNTFLQYIHTGFFTDQNDIIRFESKNDNIAYKTSLTQTIIGDGPNLNSPGHLEVRDDTNQWVLSEIGWKVNNIGTAKNISQLLANEQIKGQLKPVRKFMQTSFVMTNPATKFLQPHYAIEYNSKYYIFHGGTYDLNRDTVNGIWFEVKED
jgi:hypothetical protein